MLKSFSQWHRSQPWDFRRRQKVTFRNSQRCVADGCVFLGYDTALLNYRFLTFRDNVVTSSFKIPRRYSDPWRWDHCVRTRPRSLRNQKIHHRLLSLSWGNRPHGDIPFFKHPFLDALPKFWKGTISFAMSVRPHGTRLPLDRRIFMKFDIWH